MTIKQLLESYDEPLNEGFVDSVKNLWNKVKTYLKKNPKEEKKFKKDLYFAFGIKDDGKIIGIGEDGKLFVPEKLLLNKDFSDFLQKTIKELEKKKND